MRKSPVSSPGRNAGGGLTVLTMIVSAALLGCGSDADRPDAYGNFEAVETTVSAQTSGQLTAFDLREGDELEAGTMVGQVDTVQLSLARSSLLAQRGTIDAQIASTNAEAEVLIEQKRIAQIDKRRIDRLFEQEAATEKQVDDINGQISVLDRKVAAVRSKAASLESQQDALDAEIAKLEDRIERSTVVNPVAGTVLTTFVEPHELVSTGSPLYRIADLSKLDLRAFLSEAQLSEIAIGDAVSVSFDGADGELETIEGTVTWIASQAEFTPRTVQTREERVNLVYAIKVRVPNPDGRLKIGMPADVRFAQSET